MNEIEKCKVYGAALKLIDEIASDDTLWENGKDYNFVAEIAQINGIMQLCKEIVGGHDEKEEEEK